MDEKDTTNIRVKWYAILTFIIRAGAFLFLFSRFLLYVLNNGMEEWYKAGIPAAVIYLLIAGACRLIHRRLGQRRREEEDDPERYLRERWKEAEMEAEPEEEPPRRPKYLAELIAIFLPLIFGVFFLLSLAKETGTGGAFSFIATIVAVSVILPIALSLNRIFKSRKRK